MSKKKKLTEQKEGIDMDEKKADPSGYEPNFVMKDAQRNQRLLKTSLTWLKTSPTCRKDPAKAAAPPGDREDFATESGFWRIK